MQRVSIGLVLGAAAALGACSGQAGNETAANEAEPPTKEAGQRRTIGDALAAAGDHSELVGALNAAGLAETLRGAGPYTLLAPTNAAFGALQQEARDTLLQPASRDRLVGLLRLHIVPGAVTVQDMRAAIDRGQGGRAELATLQGETLTLSRDGDSILIGDGAGGRARVIGGETIQANGVVHGIDAVLMPAPQSRD